MFIFILALLNLAVGLPFTKEIAQQIFTSGQNALFIFYDGSHQHTKSTKEALDAFSELSIDITLIEADVQLESVSRLMNGLGLDTLLLPSVRLLEMHGPNVGDIHKYSYDEQITSVKLTKFIERYVDGELLPDFKSEDIPTKQYEDGIAVVVGHNYDQFVLDSTRHALIFLYSKTCEHCTSMLPNLISLNKVIRSGKTPINPSTFKIGKMDVTVNDGVVVTILPTLHLHTINSKENTIEYSGDRTAEGMLKWLENTLGSNQEL